MDNTLLHIVEQGSVFLLEVRALFVNPLPLILTAVGIYFLYKLRFFFILHPIRTARHMLRGLKSRGAIRSLCLALAGTLGVGNIFGVCVGLLIGGAGSVFWMLVSVVFASVIKYAEVVISQDRLYRLDGEVHGGMQYVLRHSFGRFGGALSRIYSIALLGTALFMGATMQTGAFVGSTVEFFDTPRHILGVIFVSLVTAAIIGGAKIIEKITEIIIPVSTIIYIFLALFVVIIYRERIDDVLSLILRSAFSTRAGVGGFAAFLLSGGFKEGFSRGLLSNEAGAGTSSVAHSRSGILNPAVSGLMGIFEVFVDTALLCTLTAFAVLLPVPDPSVFSDGVSLLVYSFSSALGDWVGYLLMLSVFSFAFCTVICWYFYGTEALSALFGRRIHLSFLPLYLTFCFIGAFMSGRLVVEITDMFLLILVIISSLCLIKNSDRIRTLSERGGVIKISNRELRRKLGESRRARD